MSTAEIRYRDIPGYPGYRATSDGHIESCWTVGRFAAIGTAWRSRAESTLRRGGYKMVSVNVNRKPYRRYVHRLVCAAFHGPCPEGMECCHKDGVTSNNASTNLRWGTPRSNYDDRGRHAKNGVHKLIETDVREIHTRYRGGELQSRIAASYGITRHYVSAIVNGKQWRHVYVELTGRSAQSST